MRQSRHPQISADIRERRGGHGKRPEAVRERAVIALLTEKTISDAAKRAGVHERTLRQWMREDAEFRAQLETSRRLAFEAGMARVQALTGTAIETLATLLEPEAPPAVRLGAARTIAELGIHEYDAAEILRRLDDIERQAQNWR